MRRKILPFILGGALAVAAVAPAAAGHHTTVQRGGAAGLVAAVVQVAVSTDDINILNNSLNNLLRNADIDVLNNVLNNTLRNADIDVTLTNILNDNNVVVGIGVVDIETGDLLGVMWLA